MSESVVCYGDLPNDFRSLIEQLIQDQDNLLLSWIQNNPEKALEAKIPVHGVSVADCWEIVREWEECFDRGEPHIQQMCQSLKESKELPPILQDNNGLPLDGRHRISAAVRMNMDCIDAIGLDEVLTQMKRLRYRHRKEMDAAMPESDIVYG